MNSSGHLPLMAEIKIGLLNAWYTFVRLRYGERRSSTASPGIGRGICPTANQRVVEAVALTERI